MHFQLNRLLNALKNCTASMTLSVRQEIASYFVPELEAFVDLVNELGFEMKGVLESVIAKETAEFDSALGGRSGASDHSASEHRSAAWNRPEFGWSGKSLNHVRLDKKISDLISFIINPSFQTLKTKDTLNMNKFHRHLTILFSYLVQEK